MPSDLIAFLNARLAEEHYLAHKFVYVDGGEWTADELGRLWWYSDPPKSRSAADPIIQHVARYNPARALREVAAKRAILADHQEHEGWCLHCERNCKCDLGDDCVEDVWRAHPCPTLRHLAAVYSDHPDYDPAWQAVTDASQSPPAW